MYLGDSGNTETLMTFAIAFSPYLLSIKNCIFINVLFILIEVNLL